MLPCIIGEDVDLGLDLGVGLGQVRVDSAHISEVLLDLAINARDVMPNGGELTIATQLSDGREVGVGEGPEGRGEPHSAHDHGYRRGDRAGGPAANLRAVLYDEGGRSGNRAGLGDGVWDHPTERRLHRG